MILCVVESFEKNSLDFCEEIVGGSVYKFLESHIKTTLDKCFTAF